MPQWLTCELRALFGRSWLGVGAAGGETATSAGLDALQNFLPSGRQCMDGRRLAAWRSSDPQARLKRVLHNKSNQTRSYMFALI